MILHSIYFYVFGCGYCKCLEFRAVPLLLRRKLFLTFRISCIAFRLLLSGKLFLGIWIKQQNPFPVSQQKNYFLAFRISNTALPYFSAQNCFLVFRISNSALPYLSAENCFLAFRISNSAFPFFSTENYFLAFRISNSAFPFFSTENYFLAFRISNRALPPPPHTLVSRKLFLSV